MSECLNHEQVNRYIQGTCEPDEKTRIERHLESCEACRRCIEAERPTLDAEPSGPGLLPGPKRRHGPQGEASDIMPEVSVPASDQDLIQQVLDPLFEDYQIIQELPRGGQAVVYKAIHKATKKKVALKILLPTLSGSAKARRYFEREVELAASLSHPNIVTILDSGIARGQYYFSMEYIRGESLDDYLSARTLAFKEKILLFKRVCEAMTHAHQHGVIHRDLKPSNILVDERGEPHIVDFGLAKSAGPFGVISDTVPMLSLTGEIKGTVSYMSPEQAEGRADRIDVRSDVYSLAVILYRMLTGQFPYDVSGGYLEVAKTICKTEPTRPRQIIHRFDSDVEAILLKGLAKDRFQRYQSAAELGHDLDCWLQGLPIVAKSVSSLYLLKKIVTRHYYGSAVLGLLLIILLSSAAVSYAFYQRYKHEAQERQGIIEVLQTKHNLMDRMSDACFFASFLESWRQGDAQQIKVAKGYAASGLVGEVIGEAVRVLAELNTAKDLLDHNAPKGVSDPNTAKDVADSHALGPPGQLEGFRHSYEEQVPWLVDFCIGEAWLKQGEVKRARESLQASRQAFQEGPGRQRNKDGETLIMEMLIKSQLTDLSQSTDQAK